MKMAENLIVASIYGISSDTFSLLEHFTDAFAGDEAFSAWLCLNIGDIRGQLGGLIKFLDEAQTSEFCDETSRLQTKRDDSRFFKSHFNFK